MCLPPCRQPVTSVTLGFFSKVCHHEHTLPLLPADALLLPPCSISNPDNLALFPDQQVLIIGEDTAYHQVRTQKAGRQYLLPLPVIHRAFIGTPMPS